MIHHVEVSLFPNWVGREQRRSVEWDGDRLILATPPIPMGGTMLVHRLVWERVSPMAKA